MQCIGCIMWLEKQPMNNGRKRTEIHPAMRLLAADLSQYTHHLPIRRFAPSHCERRICDVNESNPAILSYLFASTDKGDKSNTISYDICIIHSSISDMNLSCLDLHTCILRSFVLHLSADKDLCTCRSPNRPGIRRSRMSRHFSHRLVTFDARDLAD